MMDKDGKILLVETDPDACGQLHTTLKGLSMGNEVLCFSDAAKASEFLNTRFNEVFLVLQNVASPGLQLPESRNMIYMHEKFNIAEIAYMFLIHPAHRSKEALQHTFVHTYYRTAKPDMLKNVFTGIMEYWKAQILPIKMQLRQASR